MLSSLPSNNVEYINSTDFQTLETRLQSLKDILDDKTAKLSSMRQLRYAQIDIEAERAKERIGPDELYIPQHLIDTNIRQEQSAYIQYVTESPRAVICIDEVEKSLDLSLLEQDLTSKLRFPGWQLGMYSNIDGFQANGYSVMESVYDKKKPGHIGREMIQYSDFAFINDTRDIQNAEMLARSFYFTKTQLQSLKVSKPGQTEDSMWDPKQIDMLLEADASDTNINPADYTEETDRSLYRIQKVMFRVSGTVNVGWVCIGKNDDWLRKPRPLFTGRVQIEQPAPPSMVNLNPQMAPQAPQPPQITPVYETEYPYFLYPYLISENDTIACLKGRVFLDQDTQNATSSLLSSTLTQARRASMMLFSKDTTDPNDDFAMQKNIHFSNGAIINAKLKEFHLEAPDPTMFSAIQLLVSSNQQETSQVNYAETNKQQDSRKTAAAIKASMSQQQQLSGVQVTLFSVALKAQLTYECDIIKSRVLAGLIKVSPILSALYARNWTVKPSGDTDVIEKQQIIAAMQNAWPIMVNTPAAQAFMSDLLEKMFPDSAQKYIAIFNQANQQQQSAQAQQMQQMVGIAKQAAQGIIDLSQKPEMFSETGRIHAYPIIEQAASKLEQLMKGQ